MSLVAGLRLCNENLTADNRRLSERLERSERSATFWREAWERVVFDLGKLIADVQARPKGRRFATVLELRQLLNRQAEAPDDEEDGHEHS